MKFSQVLTATLTAGLTAAALTGPVAQAAPDGAPATVPGSQRLALPQDDQAYDELIVRFTGQGAATERASALAEVGRAHGVGLSTVRTLGTGATLVRADHPLKGSALTGLLRSLQNRADVQYAEPNARMYALSTPNDPSYPKQWDYFETTGGMRLPAAWDTATGAGSVVAVLDTGITSHPDLNANVIAGYDFISSSTAARDGNGRDSNPADQGDWMLTGECGGGYPDHDVTSSWHGTHVAGTVAAVTNNSTGVAGVAPGAKIEPVRVLGKCGGTLADIADAIVWASGGSVTGVPANAYPADVINMSLGGSGTCSTAYQDAINAAVSRGTTVVVAAGNENQNAANTRPASCSNVVVVGASDREGNRASYSNYGSVVDVSAPGGETAVQANGILSTLNSGTTTPGTPAYAYYQGTSMATPHVAGLVALMLGQKDMTPAQVESSLKANARPFPGTCTGGCGAGIVDAAATIASLGGGGGTNPPVGTDVITNGTFEAGASGWSGDTWTINTDQYAAYQGVYKAWLLGYGTTTTEKISQTVTVPANGKLSFYLRVDSAETSTYTAYDTMKVVVRSTGGTLLKTAATYSNLNETSGYVLRTIDLSAYAGQTVSIGFEASEDSSAQTSFLVDNVSLVG